MSAIALSAVTKRFGASEIIRGVDLTVNTGERHALIGPNGAGKSTLFNLISGQIRPSSGEIFLNGRRSDRDAPEMIARRGVARSFQITSLFARLSVFETLRLGVMATHGVRFCFWRTAASRRDVTQDVFALLGDVNLTHRADTPVSELPYSEQRALELAVTLALRPDVILLDEPTAGMSVEEAAQTVALVRRLTAGRTLLVVEHDMDVVFSLCDRISVLVHGRIIATGTPDEIANNDSVNEAYLGKGVH
jgi:branched-chain amino acid transport system ATP-binding protein